MPAAAVSNQKIFYTQNQLDENGTLKLCFWLTVQAAIVSNMALYALKSGGCPKFFVTLRFKSSILTAAYI